MQPHSLVLAGSVPFQVCEAMFALVGHPQAGQLRKHATHVFS